MKPYYFLDIGPNLSVQARILLPKMNKTSASDKMI